MPESLVARSKRATLAVLAALLLPAGPARANGGESIAGAPALELGAIQSGGGQPAEYYRLALYGGDRIVIDYDSEGESFCNYLRLLAPSVTDYTINQAQASQEYHVQSGKQQVVWQAPFSGSGLLQLVNGCGHLSPYTMTVTLTHRTLVSVHAPSLARRGAAVTVTATVSSPAGTPTGSCLITGRPYPVTNGQCSGRVRVGHRHRQTIYVEFVPEDGWQPSAGQRTIRLVR